MLDINSKQDPWWVHAFPARVLTIIVATWTFAWAAGAQIFDVANPICYKWSELPPISTLPKTNITPENGWLEYEFPFGKAHFLGAMLVSGRVWL